MMKDNKHQQPKHFPLTGGAYRVGTDGELYREDTQPEAEPAQVENDSSDANTRRRPQKKG